MRIKKVISKIIIIIVILCISSNIIYAIENQDDFQEFGVKTGFGFKQSNSDVIYDLGIYCSLTQNIIPIFILQPGIDLTQDLIINFHADIKYLIAKQNDTKLYTGFAPSINLFINDYDDTMKFGSEGFVGVTKNIQKNINVLFEYRYCIYDLFDFDYNVSKFFIGCQINF